MTRIGGSTRGGMRINFEPGGVHDGEDQQRQHGCAEQASGDGNGHWTPEGAGDKRRHAENGGGCGQHDGTEAQDRGIDDGIPGRLPLGDMLFNLIKPAIA